MSQIKTETMELFRKIVTEYINDPLNDDSLAEWSDIIKRLCEETTNIEDIKVMFKSIPDLAIDFASVYLWSYINWEQKREANHAATGQP